MILFNGTGAIMRIAATVLLLLLRISCSLAALAKGEVFQYNVCNGLSNQLLIHASAIATAIKQQAKIVQVPDYFIVHGEQTSDEPVLPQENNSVPLQAAFDTKNFVSQVESLGIKVKFVKWEYQNESAIPDCPELSWLRGAHPGVVLQVLQAFQPSATLVSLMSNVMTELQSKGLEQGICFHHRDGQDWHDHCDRWSAVADNTYRGNCQALPNRTTLQLLQDRALSSKGRWVYYCGDHEIPSELEHSDYQIVSKDQFLTEQNRKAIESMQPGVEVRDLWALIDFYICSSLNYFVGNSVSTFSALQIALRKQGGAYWYNSQSIPLSTVWDIYQIPIVYTYTELSDTKGKYMLQASIASVRQHMPQNQIYVLYHGKQDHDFQKWLHEQSVTLFNHDPEWQGEIEHMRRNGNADTSHLFLHSGNYLGTWQRIDIPKFIEAEYCLLLDADTVVMQSFTLADFGLNLTTSIGMSAERHRHHTGNELNAGVTLMNVPKMRATYDEFIEFILEHVDRPAFNHPAPSDQGAYLEFYQSSVQQISNLWNWKAYWGIKARNNMFRKIKVLHFHGIKPHDYVRKVLGQSCPTAIRDLCDKFKKPIFRITVQKFLLAASSVPHFNRGYCDASFDQPKMKEECETLLGSLKSMDLKSSVPPIIDVHTPPPRRKRNQELAQDGFWDGDHSGLNKRVVTVSRRTRDTQLQETNGATERPEHELSYEYLDLSDAMYMQQDPLSAENSLSLVRVHKRMLLLSWMLSLFFLFSYFRKNRRFLFIFLCGSLVLRRIVSALVVEL